MKGISKSRVALALACFAVGVVAGAAMATEPGLISATVDASKLPPAADEHPAPLPEGDTGIASKHPGDASIADDPAVIFAERFAESDLISVARRWSGEKNQGGKALALSNDAPPVSPSGHSLQMTIRRGTNSDACLWKRFDPGLDVMYARFYVKFSDDHPYVDHLVTVGGWRNAGDFPLSGAQYRQDGTRSFQTGLELTSQWTRYAPPGEWFLYTYWPGMRSYQAARGSGFSGSPLFVNPPQRTPRDAETKSYPGPDESGVYRNSSLPPQVQPVSQGTAFYGNSFLPNPEQQAPRGRWQCMEVMIKLNSAPERYDGEQAFWVDGKLAGRWAPYTPAGRWVRDEFLTVEKGPLFEGFRWRTVPDLKINTFWLLYSLKGVFDADAQFLPQPGVAVNRDSGTVWFADIVIATQYIGPIAPRGPLLESTAIPAGKSVVDCSGCHQISK